MHQSRGVVWLALGLGCLSACDAVYQGRVGEFYAGPVDPVNFAPDYLGTSGNRLRAGQGSFTARTAYVSGTPVGVYYFSAPPSLRASANAEKLPAAPARVYAFSDGCAAGESEATGVTGDGVDYTQQGAIFTRLPEISYAVGADPMLATSWTYVPVVTEVPVTPAGAECQAIKSERTLVARAQAGDGVQLELQSAEEMVPGQKYPLGKTQGKLRALAVIDPGAAVLDRAGKSPLPGGLGLQKWGWYGQFMLAYLDGGELLPQAAAPTLMKVNNVYVPRKVKQGSGEVTGVIGKGYEVLEYQRGHPEYSPLCKVNVYDTGAAMLPADLPRDARTIIDTYGPGAPTPRAFTAPVKEAAHKATEGDQYVYCLQLQ